MRNNIDFFYFDGQNQSLETQQESRFFTESFAVYSTFTKYTPTLLHNILNETPINVIKKTFWIFIKILKFQISQSKQKTYNYKQIHSSRYKKTIKYV